MPSFRPTESRRAARIALGMTPEPALEFLEEDDGSVWVMYSDENPAVPATPGRVPMVALARVTPQAIIMFPRHTNPERGDYLEPKYGTVKSIVVTARVGAPLEAPHDEAAFEELLAQLPQGFSRDYRSGLGLLWEYRFIVDAVASMPGVTNLVIHGEGGSNDARLDEETYLLGVKRFKSLVTSLTRATRRYQRQSLIERKNIAHNLLLHASNKELYPAKHSDTKAGSVAKFASTRSAAESMTRGDRSAALKLVKSTTRSLATEEPRALYQLKQEIELITLGELIRNFEEMLEKSLSEQRWQQFLQENPFILSLAFAVPAMLINGLAYVGGMTAYGYGGKVGDFLLATASTGSLALLEIKTPETPLLAATPYRGGIHAPSSQLSGTLAQALDQRAQLQSEWVSLCMKSGLHDKHGYAISSVILIGKTPAESDRKKSFDLMRNAVMGVAVVTFDELLGRLREIHGALSPKFSDDDVPF